MATGTAQPVDTGDDQPDELLLTVEETAHRLRPARTLVHRLISSGELESVTVRRLRRRPAKCLPEYAAALDGVRNPGATDGSSAG